MNKVPREYTYDDGIESGTVWSLAGDCSLLSTCEMAYLGWLNKSEPADWTTLGPEFPLVKERISEIGRILLDITA